VENSSKSYFTDHALSHFAAAEGLTVQKIICHLWVNSMDREAPVEIIDNVELHFGPDKKLTIGCDVEGTGLEVVNFNYDESTADLKKEFGDKIRMYSVDASATKMWQDVVGKVLIHVRLTKEDGKYMSDTIVLDFGEEKREIKAAPLDGVIIDYYEE
jgi:hypothetical protein